MFKKVFVAGIILVEKKEKTGSLNAFFCQNRIDIGCMEEKISQNIVNFFAFVLKILHVE